ncbi:hypothetical protein GCM10010344_54760 [Streptomyces bluensis]|nr:hypothetical protein GCM10010344_54760 [Streptomyces bluensis]
MPDGRPEGLGDVHRDDHGEFDRGQVGGRAGGGHVDPQMCLDLRAAVRAQSAVEVYVQPDVRLRRPGLAAHVVRHRSFPFVTVGTRRGVPSGPSLPCGLGCRTVSLPCGQNTV